MNMEDVVDSGLTSFAPFLRCSYETHDCQRYGFNPDGEEGHKKSGGKTFRCYFTSLRSFLSAQMMQGRKRVCPLVFVGTISLVLMLTVAMMGLSSTTYDSTNSSPSQRELNSLLTASLVPNSRHRQAPVAHISRPIPSNTVFANSHPTSSRPANIALWSRADFDDEFDTFTKLFAKSYVSIDERSQRSAIFRKNLNYIYMHNEQNFSYTLKINQFGDLTTDEFRSHFTSKHMKDKSRSLKAASEGGGSDTAAPRADLIDWNLLNVDDESIPESLDWRERGCVTEVKNQEKCGSCWAFSTTGAVEGAICARTGVLPDLSEQQLVDCANPEGNLGCNGGEADWGFQYILDNGGLCNESAYPYMSHELRFCAAKECRAVGEIQRYTDVPPRSEKALRAAVASYGPVSVAIEADQAVFQFYNQGVFEGPCGTELDHAVLVVGYGTDEATGEDYFIVKNSWGTGWGENGYIRMARHVQRDDGANSEGGSGRHHHGKSRHGECGILLQASFALA